MQQLNTKSSREGKSVIYVLESDQACTGENTLAQAQIHALKLNLPLAVIYCFESQQYSKQDYQWIVQALKELEKTLNKLSIPLIVLIGEPKARMKGCINHLMPASIYFDIASSGNSNELPQYVAEHASCSVYAVEADLLKDHKITCHPHTWSGPVIPISQLEERIHEELTSFNNF